MIRGNHNDMVKKTGDVSEMFAFIVDNMATKDDIAEIWKQMATKDDMAEIRGEMATGLAGVRAEMADMRREMATKADLEDVKEEIMAEIRPLSRALDQNSERIINHERRITKLEESKPVQV